MKEVVVIGAGKIGFAVAGLLASAGDYQVTLADRSPEVLGSLDRDERIRIVAADVEDSLKLIDLLNGQFAVLNAAPFRLTKQIAEAARAAGTHYLDLTEDVVSTRRVRELAANSNTAFIPQCGLAPGFVSIVAFDMAKGFEVLDSVRLRVGALPQYPSNALNYNLTWSTDGVINEYCEACEAIVNGARREVPPLEEREEFSLDGVTYEAFNTSDPLRHSRREGPHSQLPHDSLSWPRGDYARTPQRSAPARSSGCFERYLGARCTNDPAGCGDCLRHRQRSQERSSRSGDLREQDLQPRGGRPDIERHSNHDGCCDLYSPRPAGDRRTAAEWVHSSGGHSAEGLLRESLRRGLRQA